LDLNHDKTYLEKIKQHEIFLTDNGATIDGLQQEGFSLDNPKQQEMLEMTLKGFGVNISGRDLRICTTPDNFTLKKHNLIQTILAVNDMFYLTEHHVIEDVRFWLDESEIRYSEGISFIEKSG
jgi:hypothetical protein